MTMPISTGTSYSSRSSIVGCVASISSIVSKRCTRIASRSPYGIGCRTSATLRPASSRIRPTLRLVWLLPQPVRTAQTETTGFSLSSIVAFGPSRREVGAGSEHDRRLVHDLLVREVGVGEDDLVDAHSPLIRSVSSCSGLIGMPFGYRGPASEAG